MDILDKRGEKRILIPSPSPSCDLEFDLRTGDSASAINPRHIPKKRVFKSSQTTRSALPADLLHADKDNIGKQLDGFVPSISGDSPCEDSDDSEAAAGSPYEWKVVPPRRRNRSQSPAVTRTGTGVTESPAAAVWPGGVQLWSGLPLSWQ